MSGPKKPVRFPTRRVDREGPVHDAILRFVLFQFRTAVVHHSPNELAIGGNKVSKAIAQNKAKRMGMRPGWPDLEILWEGNFWTLEIKSPKEGKKRAGVPTKEQIQCGEDIIKAGGKWAVVHSVSEAKEILFKWREDVTIEIPFRGQIT